ncbi:ParA family protein [Frankia sp. ACN10a]|uniref:ParA family protein n=1 Tax=Frankia sp. ACN10a TaxID=2926031 RepID=UPI000A05132D|nr:AAA family ATPase [Frankia sp. ACN10a]
MFNNKGGVSKTTTCFNLGWMLAERGHTVVMMDADPQCNLTGMVMDLTQGDDLADFYRKNPGRNIKDALEPAFKSRPRPLKAMDCVEVEGRERLFLMPGHVGLAEDEVSLGIAQQLSESVQALKNIPGSFGHLISLTANRYKADYVLLDLSPGLGSINQNLVTTANHVIIPASPDVFSVMAIDSLARVIPQWVNWARRAAELEALSSADYPFPDPNLTFLGVVIQRYRLKNGKPAKAFETYFNELDAAIVDTLVPALRKSDIMLPDEKYVAAQMEGGYRIASISDFHSLIAVSQQKRKPVYSLTREDVKRGGRLWENTLPSIQAFRETFAHMAERVEKLTGP